MTVVQSLDAALAAKPELIVIASPSALHLRPVLAAIESRTPFYVEKPVVASREDTALLRNRIARGGLPPNMVGCNLRFLHSLTVMRAMVKEGRLGRIARADFEAGQWLPDWRPAQDYRLGYSARASLGGGVCLDLIHEVDAALWMFGRFDQASGFAARTSGLDIDSDDSAALLLARAAGPIATVRIDYVSRRPVRRYTLVGDTGTLRWDLRASTLTLETPAGVETIALDEGAYDVAATYVSAMREMLAAMSAGRPSAQPIEEGLDALEVALAARRLTS
ncbi:Gfo/Idh/MocA family oxidoreductase [Piscinibacter aquaticus]|uniref:Gfo/Idh/MocA family oxidoreductase n=1 Tax=Piscinibacter aquaticus TaxID=392597 RepID=A0A5C6TZ35_9BURK|nr:Gfo/Idh/MocA family oxidoreductase [Piscinibacter aquaticus]